ncbi:hypothetical protein FGB62_102g06 [Gracilaria domingensis]|nr:hypothetical protein FGB62_102g06 [Gracilaria domingensis]
MLATSNTKADSVPFSTERFWKASGVGQLINLCRDFVFATAKVIIVMRSVSSEYASDSSAVFDQYSIPASFAFWSTLMYSAVDPSTFASRPACGRSFGLRMPGRGGSFSDGWNSSKIAFLPYGIRFGHKDLVGFLEGGGRSIFSLHISSNCPLTEGSSAGAKLFQYSRMLSARNSFSGSSAREFGEVGSERVLLLVGVFGFPASAFQHAMRLQIEECARTDTALCSDGMVVYWGLSLDCGGKWECSLPRDDSYWSSVVFCFNWLAFLTSRETCLVLDAGIGRHLLPSPLERIGSRATVRHAWDLLTSMFLSMFDTVMRAASRRKLTSKPMLDSIACCIVSYCSRVRWTDLAME